MQPTEDWNKPSSHFRWRSLQVRHPVLTLFGLFAISRRATPPSANSEVFNAAIEAGLALLLCSSQESRDSRGSWIHGICWKEKSLISDQGEVWSEGGRVPDECC